MTCLGERGRCDAIQPQSKRKVSCVHPQTSCVTHHVVCPVVDASVRHENTSDAGHGCEKRSNRTARCIRTCCGGNPCVPSCSDDGCCVTHHIERVLRPVVDECIRHIPVIRNRIAHKEEEVSVTCGYHLQRL